jgi:alkanesulfonate monooxygenase SsuD/methylene tetrahydromethanopterin reductase-like flavin-dependent oxidoreductase (luciferase family)
MLHTHMDYDAATAVERSRDPFRNYLRSAVALERQAAAGAGTISGGLQLPDEEIPADLIEELLDLTYERYLTSGSLIGSPETCTHFADRVTELGVDEIACLIDFGLPGQDVLAGLPALINFAARFR